MVAPWSDKIGKLQGAKRAIHLQRPRWGELLERMSRARIVCIGEASHGTEEFYGIRAALTQELIERHDFTAVAVEADWPDAYRVNRFVQDVGDPADGKDTTAEEALGGFKRFPSWMWRNRVVRDFVTWMRGWNDARPADAVRAGFYGIDLYSLYGSIEAVVKYLEQVDPAAARRARMRYSCFEHFDPDPQHYGYAVGRGMVDPCEGEVVNQLVEMQRKAGDYARRDGKIAPDEFFFAHQNARLIRNAEVYYRSMYQGRDESWNLRDTHMADTIDALLDYLEDRDGHARLVVWAHNSHLGDARATSMGPRGELNVGQLMRERHPGETFHLGFTTFDGSVLAAHNWDEVPEVKAVRPGMEKSWERLFHEVGGNFWLPLQTGDEGRVVATEIGELLERAIGVIYRPETERMSHYFDAALAEQFDAVIHVDRTHALTPLDPLENVPGREVPETYPSAV
ncbi:MAG: erythromycin esterase family protein [Phycisphaerae bacterium]